MKTRLRILCLLLLAAFVLQGCASRSRAPLYDPERQPSLPPVVPSPPARPEALDPPSCRTDFSIALRTEDYMIVDHKVLDNSPALGKIRFAGKYAYINSFVLFKFKAANCPNSYWISMVEETKQGVLETRAQHRDEPSFSLRPATPPCLVEMSTRIVDGKFQDSYIRNPHPGWGPFARDSFNKPVLTFSNWHYPGCRWDALVPGTDGEGVLKFVFRKGSCEAAELVCTR